MRVAGSLIFLMIGATLTGQSPNGAVSATGSPGEQATQSRAPTQASQGGFMLDASYQSYAMADAAAASAGRSLAVTRSWIVPPGTYHANTWFLAGGILRVSADSTATFATTPTAPEYQQIFDTTAKGAAVSFAIAPSHLYATWWGADRTKVKDSAPAINACVHAGNTCELPEGNYKTLSVVQISKHRFTFHCASQLTSLTYGGPSVFAPFQIGGTLRFQNHDLIENCRFEGNANVTGATVHNNAADATTFRNVTISGGPVGLLVQESVFTEMLNLQVGAGATIPRIGVKLRGCNQTLLINPTIQQMKGATALDIDNSGGIEVQGGSFEQNAKGIVAGPKATAVLLSNLDFEANTESSLEVGGGGFSVLGPGIYMGNIHVLSTAYGFSMVHASAFHVTIDAGAKDSVIRDCVFDPGDSPTPTKDYLVDNGTDTQFSGNIFVPGTIRQEDWVNHTFVSAFQGQPFGCVNCILDTGTGAGVVKGTFQFTKASTAIRVFDGMEVLVLLVHDIEAGAATFEFTGALESSGNQIGTKPIWYVNPKVNLPTGRTHGTMLRLRWNLAWGGWIVS